MPEPKPKSRVQGIRLSEDELAVYKAATERAGLSFNGWVRRALRATAELDAALAREEERRRRTR